MAKCYGCSQERGKRHKAACYVRPGRMTVRTEDCSVPKDLTDRLARQSLIHAVQVAGVDAMQEKITELLADVMAAAEVTYLKKNPDKTADELGHFFDDIEKVHTCDEEDYIEAVLERCAEWLGDDMPKTYEELLKFRAQGPKSDKGLFTAEPPN